MDAWPCRSCICQDVTTFVQMRGRARKKTGGSFMVMVANEKEEGMVKKLEGDSTQFNSDRFLVDNVKRVRGTHHLAVTFHQLLTRSSMVFCRSRVRYLQEPESSMPLRSQFTDFIYRCVRGPSTPHGPAPAHVRALLPLAFLGYH